MSAILTPSYLVSQYYWPPSPLSCDIIYEPWGQYYQVQIFSCNYGTQLSRKWKIRNYGIIHRYIYFLCYEFTSLNIDDIGPWLGKHWFYWPGEGGGPESNLKYLKTTLKTIIGFQGGKTQLFLSPLIPIIGNTLNHQCFMSAQTHYMKTFPKKLWLQVFVLYWIQITTFLSLLHRICATINLCPIWQTSLIEAFYIKVWVECTQLVSYVDHYHIHRSLVDIRPTLQPPVWPDWGWLDNEADHFLSLWRIRLSQLRSGGTGMSTVCYQ
jgi:hypothetical protein